MQGCVESFDAKNRYGQKGYALRLIYSVASKNPAFGGLWMRLPNLDASRFNALAFRVRGDAGMGYTKVLKVELKDAVDQASDHYVRNVTDQWQDVVIPLNEFEGMANARKLKEFVIVIEDTTATAKQGVIYIDDIRFTNSESVNQVERLITDAFRPASSELAHKPRIDQCSTKESQDA